MHPRSKVIALMLLLLALLAGWWFFESRRPFRPPQASEVRSMVVSLERSSRVGAKAQFTVPFDHHETILETLRNNRRAGTLAKWIDVGTLKILTDSNETMIRLFESSAAEPFRVGDRYYLGSTDHDLIKAILVAQAESNETSANEGERTPDSVDSRD